MHKHQDRPASSRQWLRRHDILNFITTLYEGDLHAKRVLSLANATLGVLTSASLAITAFIRKRAALRVPVLGVEAVGSGRGHAVTRTC